jgi:hypothetical protein
MEEGTWQCDGKCQDWTSPCNNKCPHADWELQCNSKCEKYESSYLCHNSCLNITEPCDGNCPNFRYLNCNGVCVLYGELETTWQCDGQCLNLTSPCKGKCFHEFWNLNCFGKCEEEQSVHNCSNTCQTVDIPCNKECPIAGWNLYKQNKCIQICDLLLPELFAEVGPTAFELRSRGQICGQYDRVQSFLNGMR